MQFRHDLKVSGTMSSHYGLNRMGHTCATMVVDKKKQWCEPELNSKQNLSSNRSLKFKSVKLESLVIVDHHATVNTLPRLVHTARHAMEIGGDRS